MSDVDDFTDEIVEGSGFNRDEYIRIIWKKIVKPLVGRFSEIKWFAAEGVAFTQEGTASAGGFSWTGKLAEEGYIDPASGKYIELERMLQSVVCWHLLLLGTGSAYCCWVKEQPEEKEELDFDDYQELSAKLRGIKIHSPSMFEAMVPWLVFSDLGKTPECRKRAKAVAGIDSDDHDVFMAKLYALDVGILREIIPSFAELSEETQAELKKLATGIPIHWGHVAHIEGGIGMFARLMPKLDVLKDGCLRAACSIVHICDVAASWAHFKPIGGAAYTEVTHARYMIVSGALDILAETQSAESALTHIYSQFAKKLSISGDRAYLQARLAAFLRLTSIDAGSALQMGIGRAIEAGGTWDAVEYVFTKDSGIDRWKHNPTYMPAVVLNLKDAVAVEDGYVRAFQGFSWMASFIVYLEDLYRRSGRDNFFNGNPEPLCFNTIAGNAKVKPEDFARFEAGKVCIHDPKKPEFYSKDEYRRVDEASSVIGRAAIGKFKLRAS